MATARSRSGDQAPSERRHVGLTVPRAVKTRMLEAAEVLDWSAGDWVLAAAAEQGERLVGAIDAPVVRRPAVEDPAFCALYLTPDERDELDDLARRIGLNRSALVTAVARLQLGDDPSNVVGALIRAQ